MGKHLNYWMDCISETAEIEGIVLSEAQVEKLAEGVMTSHENYSEAFYSPPSSDITSSIEREWQAKYKRLEAEFEAYRGGSEQALKRALRLPSHASISVTERGEVIRYDR